MSYFSVDQLLDNAPYLVTWNPNLALQWMDEVNRTITSEFQLQKYERVKKEINTFILNLKNYRWYNKKEFWAVYDERGTYLYSTEERLVP